MSHRILIERLIWSHCICTLMDDRREKFNGMLFFLKLDSATADALVSCTWPCGVQNDDGRKVMKGSERYASRGEKRKVVRSTGLG